MKNWTDEKLDMELGFAEAALDEDFPATLDWLNELKEEKARREALKSD